MAALDSASDAPRPGVLIVPNVLGQKEADNVVAERLAALGYVGLAGDVFGQGKRTTRDSPDPAVHMNTLNADRALLRDRLHAAVAALKAVPEVDAGRTAAIGFCFGGKAVLDLARSGGEVLGVVSFHGIFDRPGYDSVTPIRPRLLVCHGWDDPLAPPDAVAALGRELSEGGADWQLHAYGGAGHGFTDRSMVGSTKPASAMTQPPIAGAGRRWRGFWGSCFTSPVIASAAKQSRAQRAPPWIASLRSQ